MNDPIISPIVIYFLQQVNTIIALSWVIVVIVGILLVIGIIIKRVTYDDAICSHPEDLNKDRNYRSWQESIEPLYKIAIFIWTIALLISLLVPNKNTIIAMVVAKQITPKNITTAIDTGKDFKNELKQDIIDLLNGKVATIDTTQQQE